MSNPPILLIFAASIRFYQFMEYTATPAVQPPLFGKPLRMVAQFISYIAHPVFIPLFMAAILLYQHPINSLLLGGQQRFFIMAMVFVNTLLLPSLIVVLLWRLKFTDNMQLATQRDRIIPLTASIICYFWAFYVGRNLEYIPIQLQQWLLGVFLSSCAAMFVNIFKKISLHTIGVGGFVTFCAWQQATDSYWPGNWLLIGLGIAGLVGTARLIRSAHEPSEVYAGYLAGAACQLVAGFITGL